MIVFANYTSLVELVMNVEMDITDWKEGIIKDAYVSFLNLDFILKFHKTVFLHYQIALQNSYLLL